MFPAGSPVILDGTPSTPGYDTQNCSITGYTWMVQYPNDTEFGAYSGQSVEFTPNVISYLKVTLIVTAPDINQSNSDYTNTSLASIWINVVQPQQLANIDVFTSKGGVGPNATSPGFVPQELVQLYAYVTYEGAPVSEKQVVFTVLNPNGTIISITTSLTDSNGTADQSYRTPWLDNNTNDYGIWTVLATVEVGQIIVSDTVSFMYSNPAVTIQNGITLPATVARGSNMNINITFQNIQNLPSSAVLTITIYDNDTVPINTTILNMNTITGNTVTTSINIPTWAFVGTATVYVNILTQNPLNEGVPLITEQTANFQITA